MMLDIPLLGIQRMKQDGWGRRRHKWSRVFCRLLGRDAQKSFRKNSDSPHLSKLSDSSLSRQIKRLRVFGMIQRVSGTYRYYLTKLGRTATAACVHATEFTNLPTLAATA
jgi:DNA-binding HxlR family transcriptional regulator